MFSNNLLMGAASIADGTSLTFAAATGSDTNASSYTFSDHAIGTPSADRTVFVEVLTNGDPSLPVTSLTIGGSSATKAIALAGANHEAEIWYLDVASGEEADIIVNYSAAQWGCLIGVWASTGIDSGSGPTATGTSTASPGSIEIAIPAGGILLSCTTINNPTTGFTWANITEEFEGVVSSEYAWYGSGAGILDTGGSTPTITVTYTSSAGSTRVMCAAAFGPT